MIFGKWTQEHYSNIIFYEYISLVFRYISALKDSIFLLSEIHVTRCSETMAYGKGGNLCLITRKAK